MDSRARLRWEKRCLRRAARGDPRAFGELYREYAGPLFRRVLVPRLGDRQAAEDALAETFRTALERLGQFEPQGVSIYFWLSRIAMNKAMDMHRVRARTGRALASFEGLVAPLRETNPEPGTAAEQAVELERTRVTVEQVLGRLHPRYRRAIELRFLEDRPRTECAEELQVKIGTFDVVLLRALRAFRKEWVQIVGEAPADAAPRQETTP